MRSLASLVRWPDPRETVYIVICAVGLSAVWWFFGAGVWYALLLGCAATVLVMAALVGASSEVREIRWRGADSARNRGSRNDVANLSVALRGSWGRVDRSVQLRVRAIARLRLGLLGLDLQNGDHGAEIERLLGPSVYAFLTDSGFGRQSRRTLLRCLDVLDALDPGSGQRSIPAGGVRSPNFNRQTPRSNRDR